MCYCLALVIIVFSTNDEIVYIVYIQTVENSDFSTKNSVLSTWAGIQTIPMFIERETRVICDPGGVVPHNKSHCYKH